MPIADNVIAEQSTIKKALKLVSYVGGEIIDPEGNQITPAGTQGASAGLPYAYSSTTAEADPGAGTFRFNNANVASATALYIDNTITGGTDVSAFIDSWVAGSKIIIRANDVLDASFAVFTVGSVTDSTGYRTVAITYVSGVNFSNAETCTIQYYPAGVQGPAGDTTYKYVAYASAIDGTGFTMTFDQLLPFRAELNSAVEIPSPVVGDFVGLWYKATGTDGTNGHNAYVYKAYASDTSGTDFTLTFNPALQYHADIVTDTEIPSPSASDFTGLWYKAIGNDGVDGTNGTNGTNGADGARAGLLYNWSSSTGNADPTTGKIRLSTATLTPGASATLRISKNDANTVPVDRTNDILIYSDGDMLEIVSAAVTGGTSYMKFYVERQPTDVTTYYNVPIRIISGAVPAVNGEALRINLIQSGSRGGGPSYKFDIGAASGDPTPGFFRASNSNLGSATTLYFDDTAQNSLDMTTFINSWIVGGTLALFPKSNLPGGFGIARITAITHPGTYYAVTVTPVHGAAITDKTEFVVNYIPGPNVNWTGTDLVDSTGTSISGPLTYNLLSDVPVDGTLAGKAVICKKLVNNTGAQPTSIYSEDGVVWKALNGKPIIDCTYYDKKVTAPAATFTGSYTMATASAGAATKITGQGVHGLTTAISITAGPSYIRIMEGSGTGWTPGLYALTAITDAGSDLTIAHPFTGGMGQPIIGLAGTAFDALRLKIPKMSSTGSFRVLHVCKHTSVATTARSLSLEHVATGGAVGSGHAFYTPADDTTSNNVLISGQAGVFNNGATNVQHRLYASGDLDGWGSLNNGAVTSSPGAVQTSSGTELLVRIKVGANDSITICSLTVECLL